MQNNFKTFCQNHYTLLHIKQVNIGNSEWIVYNTVHQLEVCAFRQKMMQVCDSFVKHEHLSSTTIKAEKSLFHKSCKP